MATTTDDLMKLVRVAQHLDVSEHTVRAWIKAGKLKGQRINRRWFVPHQEIERFLKNASKPKPKTILHDAPA